MMKWMVRKEGREAEGREEGKEKKKYYAFNFSTTAWPSLGSLAVRMTSTPGAAASCFTMAYPIPLFPPTIYEIKNKIVILSSELELRHLLVGG